MPHGMLGQMQGMSDFYLSPEWRAVRKLTFQTYPHRCMRCGSKKRLECAHIKARSLHPRIALKPSNLGILCKKCNKFQGTRTISYKGIRGLISRSVYNMKYFSIGFIAGCIAFKLAENWTLTMMIAELQYYLSELNASLMVGG